MPHRPPPPWSWWSSLNLTPLPKPINRSLICWHPLITLLATLMMFLRFGWENERAEKRGS